MRLDCDCLRLYSFLLSLSQHALKHRHIREDREHALQLLRQIEEREHLKNTDEKREEDAVRKRLLEKGEERREIRAERLTKFEEEKTY